MESLKSMAIKGKGLTYVQTNRLYKYWKWNKEGYLFIRNPQDKLFYLSKRNSN
jgi:hypothetical protein